MRKLRSQEDIMASWKDDSGKPVVSICCITYNHEPYIEDALEGFLIQETDFPFEILIHDDASTDKTADIIREYESRYPRLIKPIYQAKNQFSQRQRSMNAEFNYTRARGEFLAICEGDDFWTCSKKLSKQITDLSKSTDTSISFHPTVVRSGENLQKSIKSGYGYYGSESQIFSGEELISQAGPAMAMCSIVVEKRVIESLREKNPDFFLTRMTHFFLQSVALMQGKACYLPDEMATYRYGHEGSWSIKCSQDTLYRFNQIRKFIDSLDELVLIFPYEHKKAISYARRKKLRQAYRLRGVSIREKFNLYKSQGDNTLKGMNDFISELFLSWLITIKVIIKRLKKSARLTKSEVN